MRGLAIFLAILIVTPALATAEQNWPGEPIDNHVYMTYLALTQEVNDWADDNSDIVRLSSIGQSYLGKELWMVVLSDWSLVEKSDGEPRSSLHRRWSSWK